MKTKILKGIGVIFVVGFCLSSGIFILEITDWHVLGFVYMGINLVAMIIITEKIIEGFPTRGNKEVK